MRIAELHQELYQLRQGNLSVTYFFTQLTEIWEELDDYTTTPQYRSVKCTCAAMIEVMKYREDACVIRFVTALNDNFAMVCSQILLMDPLPPLNLAFSMVVQFEKQNCLVSKNDDSQVLLNAAHTKKFQSYGRGKGNYNAKVCT